MFNLVDTENEFGYVCTLKGIQMRALAFAYAYLLLSLPATANLVPVNQVILCGGTNVCVTEVSQSTPINISPTLFTNGGSSINVSATVDADATSMVLRASASYSGLAGTYYTQMNATPSFADSVTISSSLPGINGSVGYLEMPFSVFGTTTQSGLGQATTGVVDPAGTNSPQFSACYFSGNGTATGQPQPGCFFQNGLVTTGGPGALLSFHYGTPFTLIWSLAAEIYPISGLAAGSADYSHTATVNGLEIFTSQGVNLVGSNVTVQTSGGEVFAVVPTPEPGAIASLAIGLAILTALALSPRARAILVTQADVE